MRAVKYDAAGKRIETTGDLVASFRALLEASIGEVGAGLLRLDVGSAVFGIAPYEVASIESVARFYGVAVERIPGGTSVDLVEVE